MSERPADTKQTPWILAIGVVLILVYLVGAIADVTVSAIWLLLGIAFTCTGVIVRAIRSRS